MFLKYCWKLGEKVQMWLSKLKIAIVEKNTDLLEKLLSEIPKFDVENDKKDMSEALYLLAEASNLMHTLKNETENSMKQLKKNLTYLRSTHPRATSKLDIRL